MAKKKDALERALGTLEYTLGFEIMGYLRDKDVNEIIVNPDTKIWVDTFSRGRVLTGYTMESGKSEQIIYQVADLTNTVCSASNPTIARNYLSLKVTENRSMSDLLRDTLRATPDRIVVGEVRGDEALPCWMPGTRAMTGAAPRYTAVRPC